MSRQEVIKKMLTVQVLQVLLFHLLFGRITLADVVTHAVGSNLSGTSCTVIIMGLDRRIVQDLLDSMSTLENFIIPAVSIIDEKKDINLKPLIWDSSCIIGMSDITNHKLLQERLFPTHRRHLIVIDDKNLRNASNFDTFQVHKFHHPITVVQKENPDLALIRVACQDGPFLNEFVFKKGQKWWHNSNANLVSPILLQRSCNKGNLPLHGKHIKASVYSITPLIYTNKDNNIIEGGVLLEMFSILAEYFKFDYEIILRDNWYDFYPNGTIGESMGDVLDGRADVSLEQFMEFSVEFGDISTNTFFDNDVFFELKPKQLPKYLNIVYSLDAWIWICLTVSFVTVCLVLYIICLQEEYRAPMDFTHIIQIVFGIIFQEYHFGTKKKTKFIQVSQAWIILITFLTMAFLGNLKSSLVRKSYEKITMTLNEMVDKDMIVHSTSSLVEWWKTPEGQLNPLNRRLLCQAEKKNSIYINGHDYTEQAANLLLQHGGASHTMSLAMEDFRSQYLKTNTDFPFAIIPEKGWAALYVMFFQKYDPRATYFDDVIRQMTATGILDYLLHQALPYKDMKESIQFKEETLDVDHFFLPLIFCSVGFLMGMVAFIHEIVKKQKILKKS